MTSEQMKKDSTLFVKKTQKWAEIVLGKISIFEDPNQSFWELESVQWSYQTHVKHTQNFE